MTDRMRVGVDAELHASFPGRLDVLGRKIEPFRVTVDLQRGAGCRAGAEQLAPVDVDWGELFRACAATGTALEINCHPERLDLPSEQIKAAREAGVKFCVDTDSHAVGHMDFLRYGVGTAQRGWLTADDVINTWPLGRLREFLRKRG